MTTSENGYNLIKSSEGFTSVHKLDAQGKQSIGYGHDILHGESFPEPIIEAQAEGLLQSDVDKIESALSCLVPSICTQNQWDALIDFGYNLGIGALKEMIGHGWDQVPNQMLRWDHQGKVVVKGLLARRLREVQLFNTKEIW